MSSTSAGVDHYDDVIIGAMASQITSLTIVYSTVYSGADQSKHQSSASLAFVWGIHRRPVNSPHKWPVTRKMFPFDDIIMSNEVQRDFFIESLDVDEFKWNIRMAAKTCNRTCVTSAVKMRGLDNNFTKPSPGASFSWNTHRSRPLQTIRSKARLAHWHMYIKRLHVKVWLRNSFCMSEVANHAFMHAV